MEGSRASHWVCFNEDCGVITGRRKVGVWYCQMGSDYVDGVVGHVGFMVFDMVVAEGNIIRRGCEVGKSVRRELD